MSRKRRCFFSSFQTPKIHLSNIVWELYPQNSVAVNTNTVHSDERNTVKMHFNLWIPRIFSDNCFHYFVQFKAHTSGIAIPQSFLYKHLSQMPCSAVCTVLLLPTSKDAATKQESVCQLYHSTVSNPDTQPPL